VRPDQLRQKDTDARLAKKRNQTYYSHKNHILANWETKLIDDWKEEASTHDSQVIEELLIGHPEATRRCGTTVRIVRK